MQIFHGSILCLRLHFKLYRSHCDLFVPVEFGQRALKLLKSTTVLPWWWYIISMSGWDFHWPLLVSSTNACEKGYKSPKLVVPYPSISWIFHVVLTYFFCCSKVLEGLPFLQKNAVPQNKCPCKNCQSTWVSGIFAVCRAWSGKRKPLHNGIDIFIQEMPLCPEKGRSSAKTIKIGGQKAQIFRTSSRGIILQVPPWFCGWLKYLMILQNNSWINLYLSHNNYSYVSWVLSHNIP